VAKNGRHGPVRVIVRDADHHVQHARAVLRAKRNFRAQPGTGAEVSPEFEKRQTIHRPQLVTLNPNPKP
jgi:hypothetical protein